MREKKKTCNGMITVVKFRTISWNTIKTNHFHSKYDNVDKTGNQIKIAVLKHASAGSQTYLSYT